MRKFTYPYFDDIIIYSKEAEEHLHHIKLVLEKIRTARLKIRPDKCDWFQSQIVFLGHTISAKGITTNKHNVKKIKTASHSTVLSDIGRSSG